MPPGFLPRTGFNPELISDRACSRGWGLELWKKMPQRKAGFKKPQKAGAERLRWERDKPCVCVANFQCVEASHSGRVMLKAVGLWVGRAEEVRQKGPV